MPSVLFLYIWMGLDAGSAAANLAAASITRSPALSNSTPSSGLVTSGAENSGCAWSTYSRAPLDRMTLAAPMSSTSGSAAPNSADRSYPRASRSGDSTS